MARTQDFLEGQLLIAMPTMRDPRFERSLVYLCAHSEQGALGIVVNKLLDNISFGELLEQLKIAPDSVPATRPVHFGGPVETSRGFVLHSTDYVNSEATLRVTPDIGLTATLGILKAIATGSGPRHAILALGYSGWAPGQLENEMKDNGWLHCRCDPELVFDVPNEEKWERALSKLGVGLSSLSSVAGHA